MKAFLVATSLVVITLFCPKYLTAQLPSIEGPPTQLPEILGRQLPKTFDSEAVREAIGNYGLEPRDVEELVRQWKALPDFEKERLLAAAQQELENPRDPRIQHIPEGPGIPRSELIDYRGLSASEEEPFEGQSSRLFTVAGGLLQQLVVFRERKVDSYSDNGHGNGILVTPERILTSAHVASAIEAAPEKYTLLRVGAPNEDFLKPLKYVRSYAVADAGSRQGDPDLAVIVIEPMGEVRAIELADAPSPSRGGSATIVALGSSEFQLLPSASTGIVTTTTARRELGDLQPAPTRTVFGASVRIFPGLSGAPVFDAAGGLVGVVTGGWKTYSGTGETVIKVGSKEDWEQFRWWTWVTPVAPYRAKFTTAGVPAGGR